MAIKIFSDKIQIGNFNLFEGNGGVQFDGQARADNFTDIVGEGSGVIRGSTSGYAAGGTPTQTAVDKWPFASATNATNVGQLSIRRFGGAGISSTVLTMYLSHKPSASSSLPLNSTNLCSIILNKTSLSANSSRLVYSTLSGSLAVSRMYLNMSLLRKIVR